MSGSVKLNTPSAGSVTLSPADTASNVTVTIPASTATLVNASSTQTLTNKTIASLVTTGTATFGGLIDTGSTGQIQFPATQNPSSNANTLDDYEEGTWTSSIAASENIASPALSSGTYTKIGRLVVLSGLIGGTVTSANAAVYAIFNLPFVSSSSTDYSTGVATNKNGSCVPGQIIDNTSINPNTMGMYLPSAAVPANGSQTYGFTISYFTTS